MFKYLTISSFIILTFISEAAPDTQLLKTLDLERALFSEEYKDFTLGDRQAIYLVQENTTAIALGVAIMIPESGRPIIGQKGLQPLANELNKLGWVTLLMPAPEVGFLQLTTEPPANNTDQEGTNVAPESMANSDKTASIQNISDLNKSAMTQLNPEAFSLHEKELIAILQESARQAANYPGFFIVIAQGTSAAWMTKIYSEKKLDIPDALVTISPFWPERKLNDSLPLLMANTPMPVLDLFSENDNSWARQTVELRKISATKSLKLQYRQRSIMGYLYTQQSNLYLSKEIYGWTTYMGW
ncbi:DUF3530 family protein [Paraglaciecola sp. 2405UD69-4]|uniref:DUF3530 family protein n=1 Tax=Paraglaciecola sp. 2405UD69-4 TaxID=3391836 RepID=UPI0039C9ABC2